MSKTSFLPPAAFNMDQKEYDAFIQVYEHLRSHPDLPLLPKDAHPRGVRVEENARLGFSMGHQAHVYTDTGTRDDNGVWECGAVACIGGHVSLVMSGVDINQPFIVMTIDIQQKAIAYVDSPRRGTPKHELFFMGDVEVPIHNWKLISPASSANAMENFLTKGEADWEDALTRGGQGDLIEPD